MEARRYFIINKPRGMLSQFKSDGDAVLLGDLSYTFPEGTNAVGRLDKDSEGLLLLTNNKKIVRLLFQSKIPHYRVYAVLVAGIVSDETIAAWRAGVPIRVGESTHFTTTACKVERIEDPENTLYDYKITNTRIPETWLEFTLQEGRFHQVRKMVFSKGHRCKRLIRTAIEQIELNPLLPGDVKELNEVDFFNRLNLSQ